MDKLKTITASEKYLNLAIVEIKIANNSALYSPLIDLLIRIKRIISRIDGSDNKLPTQPTSNINYVVTPEHAALFEKYEQIKKRKPQHKEYILDDKDDTDESKSSGGKSHVFSNKPK